MRTRLRLLAQGAPAHSNECAVVFLIGHVRAAAALPAEIGLDEVGVVKVDALRTPIGTHTAGALDEARPENRGAGSVT